MPWFPVLKKVIDSGLPLNTLPITRSHVPYFLGARSRNKSHRITFVLQLYFAEFLNTVFESEAQQSVGEHLWFAAENCWIYAAAMIVYYYYYSFRTRTVNVNTENKTSGQTRTDSQP